MIEAAFQNALHPVIRPNHFADKRVHLCGRTLSAQEAMGTPAPEHSPIVEGKEVLIEAVFEGSEGMIIKRAAANLSRGHLRGYPTFMPPVSRKFARSIPLRRRFRPSD